MSVAQVVEVGEEVYELLREVARRRGKSVEEVIVDAIAGDVDLEARVRMYLKLHEKYLREAEKLYEKGDLVQASEKYWGSVTTLLSAIAELRNLPHYTHRDLWDVIEHIVDATRDPEYSTLFGIAERLHANLYHNFMKRLSFEKHREEVLKLIKKLKTLIDSQLEEHQPAGKIDHRESANA